MPLLIDITGKKFQKLTALYRVEDYVSPKGYHRTRWKFRCDCGKEIIRTANLVVRGECCSCGCEKSKRTTEFNKKTKVKHKLRNTRLYRIWVGIKNRCYNSHDKVYQLYGKRGISMANEWREDFLSFYNWSLANGYSESLSIDRIDNNKGYYPENCRWTTVKEQNRNKRTNLYFEINGIKRCLSEWGELYSFDPRKERVKILKNPEYLKILCKEKK